MVKDTEKPIDWIGTSLEDLKSFPDSVMQCFQKKSKSGISTPKKDMDMIKSRLKLALEDYEKEKSK